MLLQGFDLSAQEQTPTPRGKRAKKEAAAQRPDPAQQRFTVQGGVMVKTDATHTAKDSLAAAADSAGVKLPADSTGMAQAGQPGSQAAAADSTGIHKTNAAAGTVTGGATTADGTIITAEGDTLSRADISRSELRKLERAERKADSTLNHHYFFKDSIPISKLTAMSLVVPGIAQFYNKQEWKIPILYGTVAAGIFFGIRENKNYKFYKEQYDIMITAMPERPTSDSYDPVAFARWRAAVNPIQDQMIRHNTNRQLLFGSALASYIYFIGDGAVNYPGQLTTVKKATTLSTICPGAGQIYNGSYWKVPIVLGGIATFAYVIDWNNRGYQRFKTAYNQRSYANANGLEPFDEFKDYRNLDENQMKKYKDSYRRNRDFCIILAAGFYVLNIIDAHVDAHLRDYDISDDLSFTMGPSITPFYMASTGASTNLYGASMAFYF